MERALKLVISLILSIIVVVEVLYFDYFYLFFSSTAYLLVFNSILFLVYLNFFSSSSSHLMFVSFFVITLFGRDDIYERGFNLNISYLSTWVKYLLKNEIIFINFVGNVVLFYIYTTYLLIYLDKYIVLLITLMSFFIVELLQYILNRGIFDLVDIIFYTIGMITSYITYYLLRRIIAWKKRKRENYH